MSGFRHWNRFLTLKRSTLVLRAYDFENEVKLFYRHQDSAHSTVAVCSGYSLRLTVIERGSSGFPSFIFLMWKCEKSGARSTFDSGTVLRRLQWILIATYGHRERFFRISLLHLPYVEVWEIRSAVYLWQWHSTVAVCSGYSLRLTATERSSSGFPSFIFLMWNCEKSGARSTFDSGKHEF